MTQLTEHRKTSRPILGPALALAALLGSLSFAEDKPSNKLRADKEALAPLQGFVGKWKGAGFLRRGSTKGAWREDSAWAWKFSDGRACLEFSSPGARHLRRGQLSAAEKSGRFVLNAELPDEGGNARYRGVKNKDGKLINGKSGLSVEDLKALKYKGKLKYCNDKEITYSSLLSPTQTMHCCTQPWMVRRGRSPAPSVPSACS